MLFAPLAVPGLSLFLRFTHGQPECNAAMLLARMAASFQVHYTGVPAEVGGVCGVVRLGPPVYCS